jgi:hypothetical protein
MQKMQIIFEHKFHSLINRYLVDAVQLTLLKYSFEPLGFGLMVGAFGVQLAGQTEKIKSDSQ